MATVNVEVNGRTYPLGCDDGQEAQLIELARGFDAQVRQIAQEVGQVGEHKLLLMAALMIADELADARARAEQAEGRAAELIAATASRIERMTARLD